MWKWMWKLIQWNTLPFAFLILSSLNAHPVIAADDEDYSINGDSSRSSSPAVSVTPLKPRSETDWVSVQSVAEIHKFVEGFEVAYEKSLGFNRIVFKGAIAPGCIGAIRIRLDEFDQAKKTNYILFEFNSKAETECTSEKLTEAKAQGKEMSVKRIVQGLTLGQAAIGSEIQTGHVRLRIRTRHADPEEKAIVRDIQIGSLDWVQTADEEKVETVKKARTEMAKKAQAEETAAQARYEAVCTKAREQYDRKAIEELSKLFVIAADGSKEKAISDEEKLALHQAADNHEVEAMDLERTGASSLTDFRKLISKIEAWAKKNNRQYAKEKASDLLVNIGYDLLEFDGSDDDDDDDYSIHDIHVIRSSRRFHRHGKRATNHQRMVLAKRAFRLAKQLDRDNDEATAGLVAVEVERKKARAERVWDELLSARSRDEFRRSQKSAREALASMDDYLYRKGNYINDADFFRSRERLASEVATEVRLDPKKSETPYVADYADPWGYWGSKAAKRYVMTVSQEVHRHDPDWRQPSSAPDPYFQDWQHKPFGGRVLP